MVDVATGWSERVAVMGRSQREVEAGFKHIQSRLPIPIIQLHPDNGSEFLNNHIVRCWREAAKGLKLRRSRPYCKNDNRFVEQKNSTLVRAYLGNIRLDNPVECHRLTQLYDKMWLYYNLFQPVMRLTDKEVLHQEDGKYKIKHKYDSAKTPFQRLCNTSAISPENKERLTELRDHTNPRELRKEIYQLLDELLRIANDKNTRRQQEIKTQQSEKGELVPVTLSNE